MDHRAENTTRVPKRRGSGESDDHWLENLDLERGAFAEDEEGVADGEDGLDEEFDEEFEDDADEEDDE